MRLDSSLSYCGDSQTLSGLSADSTNTINARAAGVAEGADLFVVVRNSGAVTKLGSITVKGSTDNSTFTDLVTVAVSDLTDGGGVNIRLPQGCPQYTKLTFTSSGTTSGTDDMTGKVVAYMTLQPDSPRGKRIGDYAAQS